MRKNRNFYDGLLPYNQFESHIGPIWKSFIINFRKFSIFTHFERLSVGPKNFSTRKGEEVLAVKIVPSKFKTWFKIEAKLCIWIRTPFFASKLNLDKINFNSTYKQYLFILLIIS